MLLFGAQTSGMMGSMAAKNPTAPAKAPGVRARVRAELTAEIKAAAQRQLVTHGASGLSLRAISRELEMSSSAISRDELLTALIIDAYDAVGERAEAADAAQDRQDYAGRFVAIATAIRTWAVENPHEYALIYGSPVPGYEAPEDTIDPATRVSIALITILVERFAGSEIADQVRQTADSQRLAGPLEGISEFVDHSVPPGLLARGVQAWGEILGLVSLELFGHFNNVVSSPEDFFEHSMQVLAERTFAQA